MKKYIITIEKKLQVFEIDADSMEQAPKLAVKKYNMGELLDKTIKINDNNYDFTVWEEF